jgi:hypothetical protein
MGQLRAHLAHGRRPHLLDEPHGGRYESGKDALALVRRRGTGGDFRLTAALSDGLGGTLPSARI